MMQTKENMFEPSGCLTREAFEALVNNQLPANLKVEAEQHLELCPFCSDALEGFTTQLKGETFSSIMDKSDKGFANIVAKNQTKPAGKRALWISISAAASILMLVGLFIIINQRAPKMQLAETVAKDSVKVEKSDAKNIETAKAPEKEKSKPSEPKPAPAKTEVNTIRFTPPVVTEDNAPDVIVHDERREIAETTAPSVAPALSSNKEVAVEDSEVESSKEKSADKASAGSDYKSSPRSLNAKKASYTKDEEPLNFVEKMPEYPGGNEAMLKFIRDNLQYPQIAAEMAISGKVFLQFVVEKNGRISNIKVLRGIGGGCDEEAIRVVKLMPNWKPGMQNGKPVPVYLTLPIIFSLQK